LYAYQVQSSISNSARALAVAGRPLTPAELGRLVPEGLGEAEDPAAAEGLVVRRAGRLGNRNDPRPWPQHIAGSCHLRGSRGLPQEAQKALSKRLQEDLQAGLHSSLLQALQQLIGEIRRRNGALLHEFQMKLARRKLLAELLLYPLAQREDLILPEPVGNRLGRPA